MDLRYIKGVGPKTIEYLEKLGLCTINDLIEYYPYRYNIYKVSRLDEINSNEEVVTIKGIIEDEPKVSYIKRNFNRMSFRLNSDGYLVKVTIFNRAFYKNNLKVGRMINVIGKYDKYKNSFTANDIKFDIIRDMKIEPVYHLTNGIKSKTLGAIIKECLDQKITLEDYIPNYLVNKYEFINKEDASRLLHIPNSINDIKKGKLRCIYEEFFIFMFKIHYLKYKYDLNNIGLRRNVKREEVDKFIDNLPFSLTPDQRSSVTDIFIDLCSEKRMNRLVLGDVGSGKTVVAIIAMYINYLSGYQSSLMAPTEILARQHYDNIKELFKDTDIKVELLTGSMKKKEKEIIWKDLQDGNIDIVIGTHALITEDVVFNNLGLVITDEQHRFGVNQRSNLHNKGVMCDVLYLSATPIPRTYALTLYGDMDTSIIKSKPNGRKEIITKVIKEKEIKDLLLHMVSEIKNGHQIYVVCPMIEEDEETDIKLENVVDLKKKFDTAFNNKISVEILHGKMKNKDKDDVMNRFKAGEIKVLISTTVIEVGVDVKNSTMMVVFNAERFGLATLHQLRGRVGRNDLQSYCYLVCNMEKERLKVMEESNDGFYISQKDFELRGEGDLFGTRQSGDMVFKVGDIRRDFRILVQCKEDATDFIKNNIQDNFKEYPMYNEIIRQIEFID